MGTIVNQYNHFLIIMLLLWIEYKFKFLQINVNNFVSSLLCIFCSSVLLKGVTGWRGSMGVKIFIFQRTGGALSHMFNKLQPFPESLGMLERYCLAVHGLASLVQREHWGIYLSW